MDRIDSFANFVIVRENDIMEERNDIVIYKSEDGLVKMEAMVDSVNETIWANQKAIAALFDVTVPNISYHFKKLFESGELDAGTVIKDFLITAQSGARGTSEDKVLYYTSMSPGSVAASLVLEIRISLPFSAMPLTSRISVSQNPLSQI